MFRLLFFVRLVVGGSGRRPPRASPPPRAEKPLPPLLRPLPSPPPFFPPPKTTRQNACQGQFFREDNRALWRAAITARRAGRRRRERALHPPPPPPEPPPLPGAPVAWPSPRRGYSWARSAAEGAGRVCGGAALAADQRQRGGRDDGLSPFWGGRSLCALALSGRHARPPPPLLALGSRRDRRVCFAPLDAATAPEPSSFATTDHTQPLSPPTKHPPKNTQQWRKKRMRRLKRKRRKMRQRSK
jgi:hypothetical protein